MNTERVRSHLVFEEGLKLTRHEVDGKDHIGYGFNLEDEWDQDLLDYLGVEDEDEINEITQEQADYILDWWIENITATISKRFGEKFTKLSPLRQECLFSMRYQMGAGGLRGFRMMWKAIDDDDYQEAAVQMLDSLWARDQSPERANRVAKTFETNDERFLELTEFYDAVDTGPDSRDPDKSGLAKYTDQELVAELARRLGI